MGTLHATLTQLLLCALLFVQQSHAQDCNSEDQIWANLQPQPVGSLTWQTCFDTKQCAKLQVPLDYSKPNGTQAVVALLKVPAAVPTNSTDYKGPILFNPGGPGGSGIGLINIDGERFQGLFGQEYDIIGFDPRGVGRTTPVAEVFPSQPEELIWQLQQSDSPLPFESADAVARLYDSSRIYADLVATRGQGFAPYVSTATVARDMLEIVRAHGRDKLQYWGFSYGSLLGMTFAAMFPNNVERIIVDGVVDTDDWFSGAFAGNLVRTDAGLDAFYQACVDVGPSKCAIHESTLDKVSARVDAIFAQLKRRPIPIFANESASTGSYGLLTYKMAQVAVFGFLYSPYLGPPNSTAAAHILRALEQGDGSAVWDFLGPSRTSLTCNGTKFPVPPLLAPDQAEIANVCADIDPGNGTVEDLETYYEDQRNISQFGDVWSFATFCKGWSVKPAERFRGPFVANTSFPILFVGNVNDTVLPVQNAIKMSKGFTGSVVLTQDSAGHCSIAANSACTASALRNYMRNGTLPTPGTVCPIESKLFADAPANSTDLSTRDNESADVVAAWRDLVTNMRVPKFGLGLYGI